MRMVAALTKEGEVIDTYTFEMPDGDNLAEAAKKAFAYFRERHPYLDVQMKDVLIAFRDETQVQA